MPATSRSGVLLRRRSASGRAGSPSKSSTSQSPSRPQHLAEVVVAVLADRLAAGAGAAAGRAGARARSSPRARTASAGRRLEAGEQGARCLGLRARAGPRRGPRARTPGRAASRGQHARACARSPRPGAAAARGTAPGRRSESSASCQPSRAPGTNACRMPSVAVMRGARVAVPAEQARGVLEAVGVQEAQQLELGALAGLEAPVGLEDAALAEHHRAVRLLAADRAAPRSSSSSPGSAAAELELDAPGVGRERADRRSAASSACASGGSASRELDLAALGSSAVGQLVELAARRRRTRPRRAPARNPARARRRRRCGRRSSARDLEPNQRCSRTSAASARRRGSQLDAQQVSLLQARLEAHVVAPARQVKTPSASRSVTSNAAGSPSSGGITTTPSCARRPDRG